MYRLFLPKKIRHETTSDKDLGWVSAFLYDLFDEKIIDIAIHKNPNLFWPKDEFETTAEYNQRLKQQLEFIRGVEKEYYSQKRVKEAEAKRLVKERAAEEERLLQIKIADSFTIVTLKIDTIGSYNADGEYFNNIAVDLGMKVEIQIHTGVGKEGFILKYYGIYDENVNTFKINNYIFFGICAEFNENDFWNDSEVEQAMAPFCRKQPILCRV